VLTPRLSDLSECLNDCQDIFLVRVAPSCDVAARRQKGTNSMQLLKLMSDGAFHSGEELGAALDVTRTAVWKQLATWRKRGLEFEAVPGKGYRMTTPLELWSENALRKGLSAPAQEVLRELLLIDRVTSTNDVVLDRLRAVPRSGIICLAEEQTAGRGRRGRKWLSPLGQNFYGSIGWIFSGGIAQIDGLSLAAGVAIVRALARYGMTGVQLKWPNDIVIGQAKLGGVLIELQAEANGLCLTVIGLGLNLHLPVDAVEVLGRPVTDIASHMPPPLRRNELGALLLDELLCLLVSYAENGFSALHDEWMQHDVLRDKPVVVTGLDHEFTGVARGIDAHGALCVELSPGVIRRFHSGEVSLRAKMA
jgi:BirA family biotin operon repressor/biotin-[acetyl-CoA-carboxylase] ligase